MLLTTAASADVKFVTTTSEKLCPMISTIENCMQNSSGRLQLWERILGEMCPEVMMEVGVWKGEFAAHMLAKSHSIRVYYMIDPWRKLPDWNKPWNVGDDVFEQVFREAMDATSFAKEKVTVLRGRTVDIIDKVDDESLDFAYVDGDHTLRGITLDLLSTWKKVKPGGYLGGDDLHPNIWQHSTEYEPTLVFPFVLYFAEAMHANLYALPYNQFLIEKLSAPLASYQFVDLVGAYTDPSLCKQLAANSFWQRARDTSLGAARRAVHKLRE